MIFPRALNSEGLTVAPSDALGQMLSATIDLALIVLFFAAFTAVIVTALHEFGLRKWRNRRVYDAWAEDIGVSPGKHVLTDHLFGLPFRQLCGVLSARARSRMNDLREAEYDADRGPPKQIGKSDPQNTSDEPTAKPEPLKLAEFLAAVPDLQQRLGSFWFRFNYGLSICVALLLGFVIYITPNKWETGPAIPDVLADQTSTPLDFVTAEALTLLVTCFFASLIAPLIVDLLERFVLVR